MAGELIAMQKAIWAIVGLLLATPASASNWTRIETYKNGDQFWIDKDSFRPRPNGFTVWIKTELNASNGGGNTKAMWGIDCSQWTVETISKVAYSADGSFIGTLAPTTSAPITPDSVGEGMAKVFCPKK